MSECAYAVVPHDSVKGSRLELLASLLHGGWEVCEGGHGSRLRSLPRKAEVHKLHVSHLSWTEQAFHHA